MRTRATDSQRDDRRINIVVAPKIRQRIRELRKAGININVSAICNDALEAVLPELEKQINRG